MAVAPVGAGVETAVIDATLNLHADTDYTVFAVGLLDPASDDQAFDAALSEDVATIPERTGTQGGRPRSDRGRDNGNGH